MTYNVLLITGSLRAGSVNSAVLKTALEVAPDGVDAQFYEGMATLPHFNPDDDVDLLNAAVGTLRGEIARADALLFCTPEYAGSLPGSFKNLLDWTVGGTEMDRKPVGWVNTASLAAPAGGEDAYSTLSRVLGYVGADIVAAACVRLPISRQDIDPDGTVLRADVRQIIIECLCALTRALRERDEVSSQVPKTRRRSA